MQPVLSVVTPCFNSYLLMSKAIDIIRKWSNSQIEWVIVDDFSTDGSYDQLLMFRDNNPQLNISIYRGDKNSGPGVSRNIGVQKARGKYIAFLDSDDFFDESFLDVVLPEIEKNRDCIIFDACFYYDEENKKDWPLFRNGQVEGIVTSKDAIVYVLGAPWGKIYKRDIIVDNKVVFLAQKSNEDVPFTRHAVSCCNDIVYIKKSLYIYVQNANSLIRNESNISFQNAINGFAYLREHIEQRYPLEVEALFVSDYLYSLAIHTCKSLPKKKYLQGLYEAEQMFPKYMSNPYLKKSTIQQRLVISCVHNKNYIGIRILLWIKKIRDKRLYRV